MKRFNAPDVLRVLSRLVLLPALCAYAQVSTVPAISSPVPPKSTTASPSAPPSSPTAQTSTPGTVPTTSPIPASTTLSLNTAGRTRALHAGDGSATFTVTNRGTSAAALALAPGAITDADSHTLLSRAKAGFVLPASAGATAPTPAAATAASANLPQTLAPGQSLTVQANVTGVMGASAAELPIYSGNTLLGSLRLFAQDAPLNLSIGGNGTSSAPLAYTFSYPVALVVDNGDAQGYTLNWEFLLDNQVLSSGEAQLPPNGSARLPLKATACPTRGKLPPECDVFGVLDRMHPSNKQGVLMLWPAGADGVARGLLPSRTLPVNLSMQRIGTTGSSVLSYIYAGILLFLGGLLSVIAGSVLPNMQAKANLRGQLKDLANRTTSLSTRIDSYLRVLLRLERKRIEIDITDATVWLPTAAEPLTPITDAIATLARRLTAAEILDDLRRKHDAVSEAAPPSVTDSIDTILQAAADQLHSLALTDAELAATDALLLRAKGWLDMLEDADALSKLIAANLLSLKTRISKFPVDYAQDLENALPGLWVILDRGFEEPKNIVRPMLFAIDHGIAAIHLALDFAMVRASVPVDPVSDAARGSEQPPQVQPGPSPQAVSTAPGQTAPAQGQPNDATVSASTAIPVTASLQATAPSKGPAAAVDPRTVAAAPALAQSEPFGQLARSQRDRLLRYEPQLMELLGTLSWRALREASQLVAQMREDIYEEDVLSEVAKPGQAEITFDTQKPRPFLPVFFSVTFKDRRYNGTAALRRLLCHWEFPDGLEEQGWKVCHYFSGDEKSSSEHGPAQTAGAGPKVAAAFAPPAAKEDTARSSSVGNLLAWFRNKPQPSAKIEVRAQIRGQRDWEAREVPIPPLKKTIQIQRTRRREPARYVPELLRFVIAFGVALAGLLSGALGQLEKLDFIPATIAILALGFGADSIKNLLTQAPHKP